LWEREGGSLCACGGALQPVGEAGDRGACRIWTGDINLAIGIKELNDDDWAPLDTHLGFGILMDLGQER